MVMQVSTGQTSLQRLQPTHCWSAPNSFSFPVRERAVLHYKSKLLILPHQHHYKSKHKKHDQLFGLCADGLPFGKVGMGFLFFHPEVSRQTINNITNPNGPYLLLFPQREKSGASVYSQTIGSSTSTWLQIQANKKYHQSSGLCADGLPAAADSDGPIIIMNLELWVMNEYKSRNIHNSEFYISNSVIIQRQPHSMSPFPLQKFHNTTCKIFTIAWQCRWHMPAMGNTPQPRLWNMLIHFPCIWYRCDRIIVAMDN